MSQIMPAAELLARVHDIVGDALQQTEILFDRELQSEHAYVRDILAHSRRFRGKRLRPILVLLAGSTCGGLTDEHPVLAAVVELIHTATLVHDDVLDEADVRRHVATVNTRWNNETSVLFGDYLFTHAFHLAASLSSTLACRWIGAATNVVCEGELMQVRHRGHFELTEDEYLQIINGKTAELCAVSCRLGAHFAGSDTETVDTLEAYGRDLGMAFQIADDLLDLLGDESEAGKTLGSDLAKQKLTLPLIRLLQTCDQATAEQVREWLAHPDEHTAAKLLPMLKDSDSLRYAKSLALEYADSARRRLARLPASPARDLLVEFAGFAVARNS
ncbi:MAG: polyprenyl synthetase family protein [Maioricimonas sp. JB049]